MDDHGVFTELRRYNRTRGIAYSKMRITRIRALREVLFAYAIKFDIYSTPARMFFLRDRTHARLINIYRARFYDIYLGACAYSGKFNAPVKIYIIFIRTQNVK